MVSEGHGFSYAIKDRVEGPTTLPKAAAKAMAEAVKREQRKARAAAELQLAPIRRALRSLYDRQAHAMRALATVPDLFSTDAIALTADRINRALAVGAIDPRSTRVMASLLRIATTNLKSMEREERMARDRMPAPGDDHA